MKIVDCRLSIYGFIASCHPEQSVSAVEGSQKDYDKEILHSVQNDKKKKECQT